MGDTRKCGCSCHTGPYAACDIPGGCGSIGCGKDARPGSCVTCPTLRPSADPRLPHRPPVCDGDRTLIGRHLNDIANLVADLHNPEPPIVERGRYERFGVEYLKYGARRTVSLGEVWREPLAAVDGVAPINSRNTAPSVSGSRERPIPIAVTVVDLKAPARQPSPSQAARDWPEDQVGYLSAATVLDQWVRDVRDTLFPDHHLPPATVDELILWLRNRVDDICDRHPAVADFADEIRNLRSALRSAAGEVEAPPQRCEGIACRRCDMQMLYRQPGGDVECVNPDCRAVYRADEYRDWIKTLVAEVRVKRHAELNT